MKHLSPRVSYRHNFDDIIYNLNEIVGEYWCWLCAWTIVFQCLVVSFEKENVFLSYDVPYILRDRVARVPT